MIGPAVFDRLGQEAPEGKRSPFIGDGGLLLKVIGVGETLAALLLADMLEQGVLPLMLCFGMLKTGRPFYTAIAIPYRTSSSLKDGIALIGLQKLISPRVL